MVNSYGQTKKSQVYFHYFEGYEEQQVKKDPGMSKY